MILLDTHVVVWLALEPARLSATARQAIDGARASADPLAVSGITLLELSTLAGKRRLNIGVSLESFLDEVESRFVVLPLDARTCALCLSLPLAYPKDPADRVIGATALVHGLPLLTADHAIRSSALIRTIW